MAGVEVWQLFWIFQFNKVAQQCGWGEMEFFITDIQIVFLVNPSLKQFQKSFYISWSYDQNIKCRAVSDTGYVSARLATLLVPGGFVVRLEVVDLGVFGVEHFERTLRLVHLRLAQWRDLVSRQRQWRQRHHILTICTAIVIIYSHPSDTYSHRNDTYSHPNDTYSHPNDIYSHPSETYSHRNDTYSHRNDTYSHPNDTYSHRNNIHSHPNDTYSHPSVTYSHRNDTYSHRNDTYSHRNDT